MKASGAKKGRGRHAIGLLVGERELHASVVASSPLGKSEVARLTEVRDESPLQETLGRMLGPWLEVKPRPRLVIGLPEVRVFHAARAVTVANRKPPDVWLQEALRTPGSRVEDMIIDMVEKAMGKKTIAALVACRRKVLMDPLEAILELNARVSRAEPAPCGLLRAAALKLRPPKGSKFPARFLLGESRAMGILALAGMPLHWHVFDLPAGGEAMALHSGLVALRMHARHWRADAAIDAVLVHGRPDLSHRLDLDDLRSRLGLKVSRADGPGFDPSSTAFGLALGGMGDDGGFDLARSLKPRESIAEIFPWVDLALQASMLVGVGLLMAGHSKSLANEHATVRASLAGFSWLGNRQEADLEKEKKSLQQKDEMAEAFLGSRVTWSDHVRDVASRLPGNTRVLAFQGAGEFAPPGVKGMAAAKKIVEMKLETPMPPSGETPHEVDLLLESIRDQSLLKREFPLIELKDLRTTKSTAKGAKPVSSYSLVCLPPPSKPGGGGNLAAAPKSGGGK
jgi:hypothetical protein